jgi:tyrosine-protein kinase Etk/Wzc
MAPPPMAPVEQSELDLRQLLDFIRAGRWTIVLIAAAVFILGALYCIWAVPIYTADGLVQIETNPNKAGVQSEMGEISALLEGTPVETQGEIQVIHSRMVLDQVIDTLNLLVTAQPRYFPLFGVAIFRSNRGVSHPIAVPQFLRRFAWGGEKIAVATWDVPDKFLGAEFNLTKTEAGFVVNSPDGDRVLEGVVGVPVVMDTADGRFSIFVRELVATPGTRFTLVHNTRQGVLASLTKRLVVAEQGKQSGVISISYSDDSAEQVTDIVNSLEDAYLRQNVERRSANAQQSLEYLEKQLPQMKDQVDQAQTRLDSYQLSHGSVDVSQETQLVLKQSVDLESKRLELAQKREELVQRFTPQHPTVVALDQQIQSLNGAVERIRQQVEKLPNTQQEIFSLTRDLHVNNSLYSNMLDSIQQLRVAKAGTVGNVRIVDHALEPLKPISPKVYLILSGSIIAGLFLGVVFVFVQRALLRGIDDPAEIESRLGLITYAMIPYSARQRKLKSEMKRRKSGHFVLAATDNSDLAIESLRSLRTSLHFAMLEAGNNVIMLTGPTPSLGKSFVSLNLGVVLAQSGKKVVVVDADLRRGHLNKYFSAAAAPGVSEFVVGDADLASTINPSPVKGLDLLFRGTSPPNPSELLMHERFAGLMQTLSAKYDYVLVDTPPVLAVTDAAIVGRLSGTTLLVLKSAEHPIREIEDVLKRLNTAGVNVRGALFNQVGARGGSYGYGNYRYSYYRYDAAK